MTPATEAQTFTCTECRRPYAADDLARFGHVLICAECKERYVQKLREGLPAIAWNFYGGFWIRVAATLIDSVILMVVNSVVQFALIGAASTRLGGTQPAEALGSMMIGAIGLAFLLTTLIACTYEALFVSSSLRATPGKLALDLKIVRPDGSRLKLGRAVARYFAKQLNAFTVGLGYIMVAFDSERRGLHDLICDTRVMRRGIG